MIKALSIRVPEEVVIECDFLKDVYGCSYSTLFENLVRAEYNKYETDPKMKATMDAMKELKLMFENAHKVLDDAGVPQVEKKSKRKSAKG